MEHPPRNPRVAMLPPIGLCLLIVLAASTGCESKAARELKTHRAALQQSLAALAEQGDVEAMRVVADVEVLHAAHFLSDSCANALAALPAATFLRLDEHGHASRVAQGADISVLFQFSAEETGLLKDGFLTERQALEIRRLATDNMAAAVDLVAQVRERQRRRIQ